LRPPAPTASSASLPLASRGIEDVVDVEMGGAGDGAGSGPGSSSTQSSTSNPSELPVSSLADAAQPTDTDEQKRARKREKRKARKVLWKARKRGKEKLAASGSEEEEKEDGDDFLDWSDGDVSEPWYDLPVRLAIPGAADEEYKRRLMAVAATCGMMSVGTYRKLCTLIDADIEAMAVKCKGEWDWRAMFASTPLVKVCLVVSDADLPFDECVD